MVNNVINDDEDVHSATLVGLGYVKAMEEVRTVWMDLDMIVWEGLPWFKPDILPHLELLCKSAFQSKF